MSEVSVKLSGDNSEFRSMLSNSVNDGVKFGGELSEKVGDKLLGLRHVSTAIATALGLNMEEIAKKTARLFTGFSEEAEEAMKKTSELTGQTADIYDQIYEKRRSASENLSILQEKENRLSKESAAIHAELAKKQDEINEQNAKLTRYYESRNGLMRGELQLLDDAKLSQEQNLRLQQIAHDMAADQQKIEALTQATTKERSNVIADLEKNQIEHAAKNLSYTEQIEALETNILNAKQLVAKSDDGSVEQSKRKLELQRAEFALSDAQLKHEEAGRLSINQQLDEALLLAKAKQPISAQERIDLDEMARAIADQVKMSPNLTEAERARLEVLALQTQEKKNQTDIGEVLKKGVKNLTDEDLHTIELLTEQNRALDGQIVKRKTLLTPARDIAKEEAAALALQKDQAEIQTILAKGVGALTAGDKERLTTLAGQNSILQQQIAIVGDLTKQFENFRVSVTRTGADYQSQSTASLQGVRDRISSQLDAISPNSGQMIKNADINNDYGAYLSASVLKGELSNVDKELNLRQNISSYARQFGESAATYKFGDADTQRALRDQTSQLTQVTQTLSGISNQLAASGLFPKNMPAT